MTLALIGAAIGVTGSWGLKRVMSSFLFGVKAWDPMVFVAAPLLLSAIALLAVWVPAPARHAHRSARRSPLRVTYCPAMLTVPALLETPPMVTVRG
jgi:hypothetical protein